MKSNNNIGIRELKIIMDAHIDSLKQMKYEGIQCLTEDANRILELAVDHNDVRQLKSFIVRLESLYLRQKSYLMRTESKEMLAKLTTKSLKGLYD